jgi:hypothetical protein
VWINPTQSNGQKMVMVFNEFGLSSMGLREEDFSESGNVIQVGYPPFRIDILTKPDGVTFEDCFKNRLLVEYEGVPIAIIGFDDFKKNKEASGRTKDIEDLKNFK